MELYNLEEPRDINSYKGFQNMVSIRTIWELLKALKLQDQPQDLIVT